MTTNTNDSNQLYAIALDNLRDITGGVGPTPRPAFANPGQCFDNVWPWAVGGATGGPDGAFLGGMAGFLTSPACGDGKNTPATNIRQGIVGSVVNGIKNWGRSMLPFTH